jgi:prophage antirepressor-like protein
MTYDNVFLYVPPVGDPCPITTGTHADPATGKPEAVFSLHQIARALGYSEPNAANMRASCVSRYARRAKIDLLGTGRPIKAVTRYGVFLATPKSETPEADHFHAWMRAVVIPALDMPTLATPEDIARLESHYLQAEIAKLQARLDAANALASLEPAQVAQTATKPAQDRKRAQAAHEAVADAWSDFGSEADIANAVKVVHHETPDERAHRESLALRESMKARAAINHAPQTN